MPNRRPTPMSAAEIQEHAIQKLADYARERHHMATVYDFMGMTEQEYDDVFIGGYPVPDRVIKAWGMTLVPDWEVE
jgi:hypothetical protein